MTAEEREVAALRRLGLTEYEARIYLALIKMGPKKASEVSFFGQVPRTKAYGTIRELERKGLLQVIPGKPEVYVPSSPGEFLMPLVTKLHSEVRDSENVVQELAVSYETSKYARRLEIPRDAGEFWRIDGRKNILEKLSEVLHDATKSVNYSTSVWGLVRAYKVHSEMLEKASKQGAVVRVLSPVSPENSAVAKQLSEVIELKQLDKPLTPHFLSVDARELVVMESKPDDLRTDRGSDTAIWTTNKLVVELHDQLFERIWDALAKIEFSPKRGQ